MADYTKITNEDLVGHKIEELADTPAMTTAALKKRFDSLSVDVIIPKFNQLVDEISNLDGNVENEFVATREYVDEKDTEKLQESKDYADEQIGIATTEIKGYSDTEDARVLTEAMAYSDDKDADTLASAKSYADTKDVDTLDTAKAYADSEDTVMLNSAKAYADTVGERKLAEANMYTDASSRDTYFQAKDYTDKNTIKSVVVTPELSTGNKVGTIAVNGSVATLYAPTTSSDIPTASQIPYSNASSHVPETKVQGALDAVFGMFGSLSRVATSGNYNDLSNKPTNATTSKVGFVKPDGETITIDADGTIHSESGGSNEWVGTHAEYEAIKDTIPDGYFVTFTDDANPLETYAIVNSATEALINDEDDVIAGAKAVKDFQTYSTEETICGKWIDGKTLYRRVFESTVSRTTGQQDFTIATSFNIDKEIKNMYGVVGRTDNKNVSQLSVNYGGDVNSINCVMFTSTGNLVFRIGSLPWANTTIRYSIIVEYTKE